VPQNGDLPFLADNAQGIDDGTNIIVINGFRKPS
jgi:hypothetical protein